MNRIRTFASIAGFLCLSSVWGRVGNLLNQAPAQAATIKNVMAGQERAQLAGAKLFARECSGCHGPGGQGGISKAPPLNQPEVFGAAPGVLFWVLRNGSLHTGMPSFAHLPEAQRWQIVTYLETLGSK